MLSFSPFGVYTLTFIENNNLGCIVVWFLSQDVSNFWLGLAEIQSQDLVVR